MGGQRFVACLRTIVSRNGPFHDCPRPKSEPTIPLVEFCGFFDENTVRDFAPILRRTIYYFLEKEYQWRRISKQILGTNYDRTFNLRTSIVSKNLPGPIYPFESGLLSSKLRSSQALMTSNELRSQPPYKYNLLFSRRGNIRGRTPTRGASFNAIFKNTLPRNIFQIVADGVPRIIDKIPQAC